MNGLISVWISVIIFYMQTIVFILLWMDCCEILSILTLIETNGLGGVPFSYLRLCDIQWKFKGLLRSPYNFYFYFFPLTLSLLPFPSYSFPLTLSTFSCLLATLVKKSEKIVDFSSVYGKGKTNIIILPFRITIFQLKIYIYLDNLNLHFFFQFHSQHFVWKIIPLNLSTKDASFLWWKLDVCNKLIQMIFKKFKWKEIEPNLNKVG